MLPLGSNDNEGVLCILQSPSITGTSPSDRLVSYQGHSLGGSAEVQLVYSTAPADWAMKILLVCIQIIARPVFSRKYPYLDFTNITSCVNQF